MPYTTRDLPIGAPPPTPLTTAPPPTPPLPLSFAPFVPEAVRRTHQAFIASDTRFAAAARVIAALWRADLNLPAGNHVEIDNKGKSRRITAGWRLRPDAAQAGATFLTPEIRAYAREALVFVNPARSGMKTVSGATSSPAKP